MRSPAEPPSSPQSTSGSPSSATTSRSASRWKPLRAGALTERCGHALDESKIRADEAQLWQNELRHVEERLAAAEKERDWAMTALRSSETELQASLSTRRKDVRPESDDVHLKHYRVLVELLTVRCRLLEQWLEEEASLAAAHDDEQSAAIRNMEDQVSQLGSKVLEQQRAFQAEVADLHAEQESLEEQHRSDLAHWSQELIREREEASRELHSLQEEMRKREDLWVQEWQAMQQEFQRQGLDLQGPPGHLLSAARNETERQGWTPSWEGGQGAGPGVPLEPIPEAEGEEWDWTTLRQEAPSPPGTTEEVALGSSSPSPPRRPSPIPAPPLPQWAGSSSGDFQDDSGSPTADPRFWHTKPEVLAAGLPRRSKDGQSSLTPSVAVCPPSSAVQYEEVPEELLQSVKRASDGPQASRAWARIGQFQQRQKNFPEARNAYQNAVEMDSSQHGCLANLAQLEAHAGNITTAQELLAAAVKLDPGNKTYSSFGRWLASGSRPCTPQVSNVKGAGLSATV